MWPLLSCLAEEVAPPSYTFHPARRYRRRHMDIRRRLLCLALAATALPPAFAQQQAPSRRILLVYLPDRPVAHWKEGIALRIANGDDPARDETRVLPLPGFDGSRMLLDSFTTAFSQAYPALGFVPAYGLCEKLAPPERWHLGALHVSDVRVRDAIRTELESTGAHAVIVLDGSNPGDSGRTNPYGSFGLYTRALAADQGRGRLRATPRWFVTVRVLDPQLNQAMASEGGSLDDMGLRSFEGDASQLEAMAGDGARRAQLVSAVRASLDEGARAAMRNFSQATRDTADSRSAGLRQPVQAPGPG